MSRNLKSRLAVLFVAAGLIAVFTGGIGTGPTHRIAGPSTTPSGPVRGVYTGPIDGPTTTPTGPILG